MRLIIPIFYICSVLCSVNAEEITLVGTPYPTFVETNHSSSRYTAIVEEAFNRMEASLNIEILRQAFVGSALRAEKADGEVAFLSLNPPLSTHIYSKPYVNAELYLASRDEDVKSASSFPSIANHRVATENRFANTEQLRRIREVKWSRNPTSLDAFKQLGEGRSNYLFADYLLIKEFNKLLVNANRPALFFSPSNLVQTGVHISLRKTMANGPELLAAFDSAIKAMQEDGTIKEILKTDSERSLLDQDLYKNMMRNW